MKLRYILLLLISLATLVTPTVVSLLATEADKNRQQSAYLDDGRRYVIASADPRVAVTAGASHGADSAKAELLEELSSCCSFMSDRHGGSDEEVVSKALVAGERLGWLGTVADAGALLDISGSVTLTGPQDRSDANEARDPNPGRLSGPASVHVAFLASEDGVVPVAVLDVDPVFVTVDEPGIGRALYRRRAFDAAWSGLYITFTPLKSATGSAP